MMKNTLILAMALSSGMASASAAMAGPDPTGIWNRGDGNARVRVEPCGKDFCATNIWVKDTSKGEDVGDVLVMRVEPKSDTRMAGEASTASATLTYSMTLNVAPDTMSTRGCVVAGVICQSATLDARALKPVGSRRKRPAVQPPGGKALQARSCRGPRR